MKLLAALGVEFSPVTASTPEAVKEVVFSREAVACDFRVLDLLPNVESVNIPGTSLGGTYNEIEPIQNCKRLKKLVLDRTINSFTIDTVLNHVDLEELTIGFNAREADESWFRRFRRLKNLRTLNIEVDDEKVALLAALADCQQLQSLSIRAGTAYEPMQEDLGFLVNLPKLTGLKVDGNFSSHLLSTLGRQNTLTSLELDLGELNAQGLKHLGASKSLKQLSLDVDKAQLGKGAFQALADVPLESLKIRSKPWSDDDPGIDDTNLPSLAAVESLRSIELIVKRVGPSGLKFLGSLPNLEKVSVNTSDVLTSEDIEQLQADNPKLKIQQSFW